MTVPCWTTHFPARTMCLAPTIWARREILLPVSVSMYSPLGVGFDLEDIATTVPNSTHVVTRCRRRKTDGRAVSLEVVGDFGRVASIRYESKATKRSSERHVQCKMV